jgi:hypothetical protein
VLNHNPAILKILDISESDMVYDSLQAINVGNLTLLEYLKANHHVDQDNISWNAICRPEVLDEMILVARPVNSLIDLESTKEELVQV